MLLLWLPFAFLGKICLDVGDQGVVIPFSGTVAEYTGFLVGKKKILIFIKNTEPWFRYLQPGIVLSRRFKEFVVDIKRQYITGRKTQIPLGGLPIDLDALEADILLQKTVRQQGNCFGYKAVETLSGIVFTYGELFHVFSP